MQTVNIHEAKTQLSRLVEQAVKGEPFIIAKAGKPLVKVTRLDMPADSQSKRLGFMAGQISVPDDFDRIGSGEIELFFSAASLWEIAIKRGLGRSDFQMDARVLRRGLLDNGYQELAITNKHSVSIDSLHPSTKTRSTASLSPRQPSKASPC